MMHTPVAPEIESAEQRFAQSTREVRESLDGARIAFRANLRKPTAWAVIAGAAGVAGALGFWAAHRAKPKGRASHNSARLAAATSTALFVRSLIMRYAKSALPFILQHFMAAGRERGARNEVARAKASAAKGAGGRRV